MATAKQPQRPEAQNEETPSAELLSNPIKVIQIHIIVSNHYIFIPIFNVITKF